MRLAVIGAGKMGQAIAGGLLKGQHLKPEALCGVSPVEADRTAFAALGGISPLTTHATIPPALADADTILLAVKPQQYPEVAAECAQADPGVCFLSIMAGIPLTTLETTLGPARPIIRCMPNTPLLVGQGAVAWCANTHVQGDLLRIPDRIFGGLGVVVPVEESQMDAVTALSGSGPAFFFRFMQHLIEAGVEQGLPEPTARLLATQTAIGAGTLLQHSPDDPETLIANVRSKGGTTEAGLNTLDSGEETFQHLIRETLLAAARRSRELAQE